MRNDLLSGKIVYITQLKGRKILIIGNHDNKFLKDKKEIIVKPLALSCGKNIEKIKLDLEPPEDLYQRL